jgi:hypothetical protein
MNVNFFFIKILLYSSYLLEQKHGDFQDFLPKFWRFLEKKKEKEEGNI